MRRYKSCIKFSVCIFVCVLSACTSLPRADKTQLVASPNKVSLQLADAADRASRALETLAAVEKSRNPSKSILGVPNAPQELRRSVTVNWVGPVEPIAADVANRAGYKFETLGDVPPTPIIVNINARNRQAIDVLRDLGLQLGTRADIKVDAERRVVEIHYTPLANISQNG